MSGWISIHRQIRDHWIWEEKPFSRGQAWIDLLMMVNHEDKKIIFDNDFKTIKRGQRIISMEKLQEKWGWSNTKVRNFLNLLEKDKMINLEIAPRKYTLVTIENYNDYQSEEGRKHHRNTTETPQNNQESTTKASQKHINNNDNNDKNDKKDIYSAFEKVIIKTYPGRKVKSNRDKKVPKILKEYSIEEITRAMERYREETKGTDRKFILNESTWWNGRYIDYLDANYVEIPKREQSADGPSKKTRFHNFEQRTDEYTADELNKKVEERARRRREEYLKKIGR